VRELKDPMEYAKAEQGREEHQPEKQPPLGFRPLRLWTVKKISAEKGQGKNA